MSEDEDWLSAYSAKKDKDKLTIAPFVAAIREVCVKYGYSISHQDCHGAFVIEPFSEANIR